MTLQSLQQQAREEFRKEFVDKGIGLEGMWVEEFIDSLISRAYEEGGRAEREQKHYEVAMLIQAVEMFMEKDEHEYGATPLHGKFRAFFEKETASLRTTLGGEEKILDYRQIWPEA